MYLQHFRLRELPFTLTPDTAFFMERAGYLDGLNVLLVALRSGEGFVKVIGEVGTGKTLLCRRLINSLGEDFRCAYLPNPYLSPASLLLSIVEELGIGLPSPCTQHQLLRGLNAALLKFAAAGQRVVVCIDEAQAVPLQTLEVLRLLTNLETEKRKLVQVVLFGQPELDEVLDQPSIRQLRQRISFSYELLPLDRRGVDAYLSHRLAVAGYEGVRLFQRRAIEEIAQGSRGVPRLINILAHKSLMAAYGQGLAAVERRHAQLAVEDTIDARRVRGRARGWFTGRLQHWLASHAS
ncbi:MAG TPA: AAA family ATPase [Gammaproteobacteria bacterium]|nr:AAA family ATPase [Gammaproteobacteria bacterium]